MTAAESYQPVLELYLLPGAAARGCLLICPGGAYCTRAPHEGKVIAERFNDLGFNAAVVQYRVTPYRWPAPQQDVRRAVKLLRCHAAEWGLRGSRVAVAGFSAGGHAACSSAYAKDWPDPHAGDLADPFDGTPDAQILCYPVISCFLQGKTPAHVFSHDTILGKDADETVRKAVCWDQQAGPGVPPAFLWHTQDDGAVPVENSLAYAEALNRSGVPCELHVFPHGAHGLGLGDREGRSPVEAWPELAGRFLTTLGF